MWWVIAGIALMLALPVGLAAVLTWLHFWLRKHHMKHLSRIFLEKPLFIIPRGQPTAEAEEVDLTSAGGIQLRGCYLKHTAQAPKGVILFGLEFGSNRWAAGPYVDYLRAAGYDVFTWEPRNQGDSHRQEGFEPLQWVTDREVADCRAAIEYLKKRPDADPRGVGVYGLSKGANAGLAAAADEPYICCVVTDGAFAHYTTMVPYMRVWFSIYDRKRPLQGLFGAWYFGLIARAGAREVGQQRGVIYPDIERLIGGLSPRPLLMIHGGADTYIKPTMARDLFGHARRPKELWIVEGANHNQALQVAGAEYKRRVVEFFDKHLARPQPAKPAQLDPAASA
ncbi:MAG TPA: prolyl oligopeptidase family serine peptidase [Gemmataceae bacterium]|jgi:pimeloyl-ACP methyl ester carboxylesterase|nr:prolyl oligopeptidase family serine peptidase [Gemmataceae bacterium]